MWGLNSLTAAAPLIGRVSGRANVVQLPAAVARRFHRRGDGTSAVVVDIIGAFVGRTLTARAVMRQEGGA